MFNFFSLFNKMIVSGCTNVLECKRLNGIEGLRITLSNQLHICM